jgi:hypothetical protein
MKNRDKWRRQRRRQKGRKEMSEKDEITSCQHPSTGQV